MGLDPDIDAVPHRLEPGFSELRFVKSSLRDESFLDHEEGRATGSDGQDDHGGRQRMSDRGPQWAGSRVSCRKTGRVEIKERKLSRVVALERVESQASERSRPS